MSQPNLVQAALPRPLSFGAQGRDALVRLVAMVAMGALALAAGSIPAWRAARVDPMKALKFE